jgi:glycosyltransferase involved in cell wall biosynthesis
MKVFLDRSPRSGPWGGGNKTLTDLCKKLEEAGANVVFDLVPGIDVIFCFDPRPNDKGVWYQNFLDYKILNSTKIIQRVGDLGTHSKPELFSLIQQTLPHSDFIIFPSFWAKNYSGFAGANYRVIPNRSRSIFFKNRNKNEGEIIGKPNVVTHHWSNNLKKGFDIYRYIDENLKDKIDFTYIGRVPNSFSFKNSTYIDPIDDAQLSNTLPDFDFYLTASREEAGANHVLEAMAAGLPVLYHNEGGSIPEYVSERGIGYNNPTELEEKIDQMIKTYYPIRKKVLNYTECIDKTIDEYCDLIWKTT